MHMYGWVTDTPHLACTALPPDTFICGVILTKAESRHILTSIRSSHRLTFPTDQFAYPWCQISATADIRWVIGEGMRLIHEQTSLIIHCKSTNEPKSINIDTQHTVQSSKFHENVQTPCIYASTFVIMTSLRSPMATTVTMATTPEDGKPSHETDRQYLGSIVYIRSDPFRSIYVYMY